MTSFGGSPGGAPSGGLQFADEPPRTTIPPGPERLVGSKELRGLDAEAAIAMAAPKAAPEEQVVQQNMEPGVVSELIKIPNEAVGLVIGRAGETIRQLQIRAGADIQVSREQLCFLRFLYVDLFEHVRPEQPQIFHVALLQRLLPVWAVSADNVCR